MESQMAIKMPNQRKAPEERAECRGAAQVKAAGETGRSWERGKCRFPLVSRRAPLTSQQQLATCCFAPSAPCAEPCHFHFCPVIPEYLQPLPSVGSAFISVPSTRQLRETRAAVHDASNSFSLQVSLCLYRIPCRPTRHARVPPRPSGVNASLWPNWLVMTMSQPMRSLIMYVSPLQSHAQGRLLT